MPLLIVPHKPEGLLLRDEERFFEVLTEIRQWGFVAEGNFYMKVKRESADFRSN